MNGLLHSTLRASAACIAGTRRFWRDRRGNAILMAGAALVPLTAAIGTGVDLTRVYMAQARLQQAVDAAALAGRKALSGSDVSGAESEVDSFMAYNFPTGVYGTPAVDPTVSVADDGELTVTAQTAVPTVVMRVFGYEDVPISATSSARRSGVNVDVVLVLDVTGSMAGSLSNENAGTNERINELRAASKSFLGILDDLRADLSPTGLRVRVGVVPYAHTVNIGRLLYAENSAYIETANVPYYSTVRTASIVSGKWQHSSTTNVGVVTFPDISPYVSAGIADTGYTNAYAWKGCVEARTTLTSITSSTSDASIPAGAWDITDTAPGVSGAPKYKPYLFLPSRDISSTTSTDDNYYGPPSAAQSTATMWKAKYPTTTPAGLMPYEVNNNASGTPKYSNASNTSYSNENNTTSGAATTSGPNTGCPSTVKLLDSYTKADLTTYLDRLKPIGTTFHTIGMFWGLALISPGAPFTNPTIWSDREIKRYIIYMTDGSLNANRYAYTSWGVDSLPTTTNNHVKTGSGDDANTQHRKRFDMLCRSAKSQGIEISTVVFGSTVSSTDKTTMQSCASSADHYYLADQTGELDEAFKRIAMNIGYLRVSH